VLKNLITAGVEIKLLKFLAFFNLLIARNLVGCLGFLDLETA